MESLQLVNNIRSRSLCIAIFLRRGLYKMKSVLRLVFLVTLLHCAKNEDAEISLENETVGGNGPWGKLLQEYTLRKSQRKAKIVQSTHRCMLTSGFFITKRMGESSALEPQKLHPGKLISPSNLPLSPGNSARRPSEPLREVSETDLYLLGAIEKLVYRVDYLEHRVRRAEQLLYYLMTGNKPKDEISSCPNNFTRIAENCYYLSDIHQLNWKSANNFCKSFKSHLAEFESVSEFGDVISYLSNNLKFRYIDLWLGGLNPGLLWIWSHSAKPVHPNTNLTLVASTLNSDSIPNSKKAGDKILNNIEEIQGEGRCLKLTYDTKKQTYKYFGEECTSRKFFLCEFLDKTNENDIKKLTRSIIL